MDGLPVRIVENYQSKNGVSVSRKSSGQKIANGHLSFTDSGQITPKVHLENRDNSDALITAKICESGIHFLFNRFADLPRLKNIITTKYLNNLSLVFVTGNDRVVGVTDKILYFNCDIAPVMGMGFDNQNSEMICNHLETKNAMEILFALGQLYAILIHSGETVREA